MVYVFLANGFEEIEALTSVDLLRRANIEVKTVGIDGQNIKGSHGISVIADITVSEVYTDELDMIVLPGGMPGTLNLDNSPAVKAIIEKAMSDNAYIAAICAAPSIIGKMGLLDGKKATCFPGFEKYLLGAEITDSGVTIDGNIICGRAMGSATEFALALITALKGNDAAEDIRRAIIA